MSPIPFSKEYVSSLWSQLGNLRTLFGPFVVNSQDRKIMPELLHLKRAGAVKESGSSALICRTREGEKEKKKKKRDFFLLTPEIIG